MGKQRKAHADFLARGVPKMLKKGERKKCLFRSYGMENDNDNILLYDYLSSTCM
jgi:hypothetical protein